MSWRTRDWFFCLILAMATVLAYQRAWNGSFIWDDDQYVTKNTLLTAPDGLRRTWFSLESPSQYFPLTYTTFRIERALWDLNPAGYHWVNILLHVANAMLVWWLLARLRIPGAWLAAGIFALHPVQVESVAWITERKNVLMGFFFLLALLAWTRFVDEPNQRPIQRPRAHQKRHAKRLTRTGKVDLLSSHFYWLALISYLLALCSKSTACTLPAALFLVLWLQKKPIDRRRALQITPFIVLGLAMGLIAMWWERYHQGTQGPMFALGPLERLIVATHAAWFYLGKLFWPTKLTFIYPQWTIAPHNPLAYIWLVAGIAVCAAIYFARPYVGRGVEVAAAFFIATLSPVLGFIMLYTFRYTFVADHYQYLASIGPIALVSAGLVELSDSLRLGPRSLGALGILIFATLGTLTWRQGAMYRDIETLWRTTLLRNPGCSMAYDNLGIILSKTNRIPEAMDLFKQALRVNPNNPKAYNNLGTALYSAGRTSEAIDQYEQALRINPNFADAHNNLGNALLLTGRTSEAIDQYEQALRINPNFAKAHSSLGDALGQMGRIPEAVEQLKAALRIAPNDIVARNNLTKLEALQRSTPANK